ncbi:hypothetical protein GGQ62_000041 [Polymorphobacter fuscus]|nr:hypothetical protein [Polymorphobacter fuscus]
MLTALGLAVLAGSSPVLRRIAPVARWQGLRPQPA